MTGGVELWTIGHSNHAFEHFLGLLQQYRIDVLADVRSQPYATHIRGDGSSIDELKLRHDTDGFNQLALFKEAAPWRSARSASPSTARKASLAF